MDELLAQRGEEFVRPLQRAVRDTIWEHCVVVRSDPGLLDHPDLDPELQVNLIYSPSGRIERSPIAATPDAITARALEAPALESAGRLLE